MIYRLFAFLIAVLLLTSSCASKKSQTDFSNYKGPKTYFALNAITPYHLAADNNPQIWEITTANLAKAKALGATHVRIDMWWHAIEPEKDRFEWELSDRVIKEITDAGLIPYPILCYNSNWSKDASPATPEELKYFGRYVRNIVERYGDQVPVFEVWNEPNIWMFWQPDPNPKDYFELLKVAYQEAKAVKPDVQMVGFALAGADVDFLKACYRLGAADYTDGIAFHHYHATDDEALMEKQIHDIRQLMKQFGDGDEPLIISESGFSTGESSVINTSTKEDQARGLVRKQLVALAEGVEQFYYFKLLDDIPESDPDGYWGLLDWNREEKPSARTYQVMTDQLGDTKYHGRLWSYETNEEDKSEAQLMLFEEPNGELVIVGWKRFFSDNETVLVDIPTDSNVRVIHTNGIEPRMLPVVQDGFAKIRLDENPKYIRDVSRKILEGVSISFSENPLVIGLGETKDVSVYLNNKTSNSMMIELDTLIQNLESAGFEAKVDEETLFSSSKEKTKTKLTLTLDENASEFIRVAFPVQKTVGSFGALEIIQSPAVSIETKAEISTQNKGELSLETYFINLRPYPIEGHISQTDSPQKKQAKLSPGIPASSQNSYKLTSGERKLRTSITTDKSGSVSDSFATFVSPSAPDNFAVDGSLDEWLNLLSIDLSPNSEMQLVPDPREKLMQPEDISGTLWVSFTDTHFIFALDVIDETPLVNSFETTEIWRGDSIQFYMGFDGPTSNLIYRPTDFQFGFSTGSKFDQVAPSAWNWKSLSSEDIGGGLIADANFVVMETENGYVMEGSVPLSEFGIDQIQPGQPISFDAQLNDLDTPTGDIFDTAIMWNGDSDNWRDPSLWGLLIKDF